ncbi:HipA domain-containing protein [Bacteroides cellulosilyticus]|uniref:HipA domain-containing protein n=1 Tax=Bacteroides cellulosilyticus TaxID=246787 RepID=UPI00356409CD
MKELYICPSTLALGYKTYSPVALKRLFGGKKVSPFLDFSFEEHNNRQEIFHNMGHTSISGLHEKFFGVLDRNHIRLAKRNEQSTYILKPAPWNYSLPMRAKLPVNEHLTMQIASQIYKIETPANGLCFASDGQPVYITRRFDINTDGSKIAQEDFAVLLKKNELSDGTHFKHKGSYALIAEKVKQYIPAWHIALERLFQLILFNYLYGNGCAHLKNFSLQRKGEDYLLSPTYDLLNTAIHIDKNIFGLEDELSPALEKSNVYAQSGYPCKIDFIHFGELIGLKAKRIEKILNPFMEIPTEVFSMIDRSFLNSNMKQNYRHVILERHCRFLRKGDSYGIRLI